MNISAFLLRIIIIALPGIVSCIIFRALMVEQKKESWEKHLDIALFSLVNYSCYWCLVSLFNSYVFDYPIITFITPQALFSDKISIPFVEVFIVSLLGLVTPYPISFFNHRKFINRMGKFLGVTRRYGHEDVWNFFHSTWEGWSVVRDHQKNRFLAVSCG